MTIFLHLSRGVQKIVYTNLQKGDSTANLTQYKYI